jgi:hypothetical protein
VSLALVGPTDEPNESPERLRLVSSEPIESEQAQYEKEDRYYDSVGRPRKLAAGAMKAIMREYRSGKFTAKQLAERYGVSVGLIGTIVYHTPRGTGLRPAPPQMRPVVVQNAEEEDPNHDG